MKWVWARCCSVKMPYAIARLSCRYSEGLGIERGKGGLRRGLRSVCASLRESSVWFSASWGVVWSNFEVMVRALIVYK